MSSPGFHALSALARARLIRSRAVRTIPSVPAVLHYSSASTGSSPQPDPTTILSRPTWSVRSLLPQNDEDAISQESHITPTQLRHLLRLSALPPPASASEEARMIAVLQSQLRFVRDVQAVDAAEGVAPLTSIRDETREGLAEATVGVEQLRGALSEEVAVGRARRPRRQRQQKKKDAHDDDDHRHHHHHTAGGVKDWDPLQTASHKAGRYFVVRSAKAQT
ncbi:hypothetical protein QBC33DRAFT_145699 [Phialemonium atrogriseum]|uniref:Glutamyl-tRNA amidotransferase complex subunit Gta3 domain-containing protein n=1 Tax=Phialemonium atrogriseum TaxID=1093897 RepID=A0AAJ0FFK0_9PEZI|nr:uncharacterized protein QBC33DRAFT_145699 [Phialemonium atrogriseum]KAK1765567.1 hypothetical protein QBC33DRAFT_145699 [Phialemonium atrogriseum]